MKENSAGTVVLVAVLTAVAAKEFSNTWVAEIEGGEEGARHVAKQLGFEYGGAIEEFDDHHILTREDHPVVSKSNSNHLTKSLLDHDQVKWAQQQSYVKRSLRDMQSLLTSGRKLTPLEVVEFVQLLCVNMGAFSERPSSIASPVVSYSARPSINNNWQDSSIASPQRMYGTSNIDNFKYGNINRPGTISMSNPTNNKRIGNTPDVPGAISQDKSFKIMSHIEANIPNMKQTLNNQPGPSNGGILAYGGGSNQWVEDDSVSQGDLSKLGTFSTKPNYNSLSTYKDATKHIKLSSSKISAYKTRWNDPFWNKEWYLHDYRTIDGPVMDLNVVPVWQQNINGEGIIVGVMDDGVENDHPDLGDNYLLSDSYDYLHTKPGAQPDEDKKKHDNRLRAHGTMCAGVIAMKAGNNLCGVGIAYKSKIIGIKIIGNLLNDQTESFGLVHKLDKVDIYSVSWGPSSSGKFMQKMDRMTKMALTKGVVMGRGRKGAVYIVSSGNGRNKHNNCGADFLTNNINTITVSSTTDTGKPTHYSNRCAGVFCTAYSGGLGFDNKVVSIEPGHGCTTHFTGTSASTPLVAGIIALVLQANKQLTYRDVMHIIVMGSEVAPLADNEDTWYRNAKGFWVSNDFGFGLVNAENMVDLAQKWVNVPKMTSCTASVVLNPPQQFAVGTVAEISFDAEACQDLPQDAVNFLELVVVTSTVKISFRGALVMYLTSPQGTRSQILESRADDDNREGLNDWSIKSVHNWGENPKGTWKLEVRATAVGGRDLSGVVKNFSLTFYGTATAPAYHSMRSIPFPRKYSNFRLPNGKTSEDPL